MIAAGRERCRVKAAPAAVTLKQIAAGLAESYELPKRHVEAMFGELLAVVGMAAETNRLAEALRVPVDPAFET